MRQNRFLELLIAHNKKIILLLLIIYSSQAVYEIYTASANNYDELGHINVAYKYLRTGEYYLSLDVSREHPPLHVLNALPFLRHDFPVPNSLSDNFYEPHYSSLLNQARLITLLFGIILGIFVFLWAKQLFGITAGLLALFLYAFEPNIIAHSGVVSTDIPAACMIFISAYFFWKFVNNDTIQSACVSGLVLGFALIAKFTAALLVPIFLIFGIYYFTRKKQKTRYACLLVMIFIIAILVVNAAYLFKGTFTPIGSHTFKSDLLSSLAEKMPFLPSIVPSAYLLGFDYAKVHGQRHLDGPVYLLGQYSDSGVGWWYYFFVAVAIKTPIPLLGLILLSFYCLYKKRSMDILFIIVPVIILFVVFSYFNRLNIGLRHVLPTYPFLLVMAGSTIELFKNSKTRFLLGAFLLWYVISAAFISPYYLSYFNEITGGPKYGWKYLADSNIDWGLGEKEIAKYIEKNPVPVRKGAGCEYLPGRVAIRANELIELGDMGERTCRAWLRKLTPIDHVAGYIIFDIQPLTQNSNTTG